MGALLWLLLVCASEAQADGEPWTVYFPSLHYSYCETTYSAVDSVSVDRGGRRHRRTPFMLTPSNGRGVPVSVPGWVLDGRGEPRVSVSGSLGMFAIQRDSCWEETRVLRQKRRSFPDGKSADTLREVICLPCIALVDTLGIHRATYSGAQNPLWSPDGERLAVIRVRIPRYLGDSETITYPVVPEGVTIVAPLAGETKTYPAPTEVLSWMNDEHLLLEFGGRRYGLMVISGKRGSAMIRKAHPTSMQGLISPDDMYVYKPGSTKLWSLVGKDTDCLGCAPPDSTEPGREGIDKELTESLVKAIGGEPLVVSSQSFWLRGAEYPHHVCLGVTWGSMESPRCEVLVVDVQRSAVLRRVEGSLIRSAASDTYAVIDHMGRITFVRF